MVVAEDIQMKPEYYNMPIPPIEYILKNDIDYCSGSIITLVSAWKKRGTPIEDLKKIIQFATFLIEDQSCQHGNTAKE
jgi:iron-sulfur cluster repair protein YtfE (RIC family)